MHPDLFATRNRWVSGDYQQNRKRSNQQRTSQWVTETKEVISAHHDNQAGMGQGLERTRITNDDIFE